MVVIFTKTYEQMGAHSGWLCPASSGQETHREPQESSLATCTSACRQTTRFRKTCGDRFRRDEKSFQAETDIGVNRAGAAKEEKSRKVCCQENQGRKGKET